MMPYTVAEVDEEGETLSLAMMYEDAEGCTRRKTVMEHTRYSYCSVETPEDMDAPVEVTVRFGGCTEVRYLVQDVVFKEVEE